MIAKKFQNSSKEPQVYYGRHISAGVCGYLQETILITDDTLKKMDSTFAGKPVYVDHQSVDLPNLQTQADGYVSESFYLKEDGSHWLKFIAVSDKAHEAIKNGYKLSNAYKALAFGVGGTWHNVPYDREIVEGEYNHLAIVKNPRYEESLILTSEEFKKYKEEKAKQLESMINSKENLKGEKKMWNLFKKDKTPVADDLKNSIVKLEDGTEMELQTILNAVAKKNEEDKAKAEEAKKAEEDKKNEEELKKKEIKVGEKTMTVEELVKEYQQMCSKQNEETEEEKKKREEEEAKKKAEKEEEEKNKKNALEEEEKRKQELLNAGNDVFKNDVKVIADTSARQLARGAEKYGSKK